MARKYLLTALLLCLSSMPARALDIAGADYVGTPEYIGALLATRG